MTKQWLRVEVRRDRFLKLKSWAASEGVTLTQIINYLIVSFMEEVENGKVTIKQEG